MSDATFEDDEGEIRPRLLSNNQILGFIARRWLAQPRRFWFMVGLFTFATLCELAIPWAAGGLVDAVSNPARVMKAAWIAWATLSGIYVLYYFSRTIAFRNNAFAQPIKLVQFIGQHSGTMKVRPDQKIVVTRDWPTADDRLAGAKALLTQLAKLAG